MALDIVFTHSDLYPYEEYHLELMNYFKNRLLHHFRIVTINRQVVTFLYNPATQKFKLESVIEKYRHNIEFTINTYRELRELME